jgi:hypothetical protein
LQEVRGDGLLFKVEEYQIHCIYMAGFFIFNGLPQNVAYLS